MESQRKVLEFLKNVQGRGRSLDNVHSKIETKVDKDLSPVLTTEFDFRMRTLDVKKAGYFLDFLRKASIHANAETLGSIYFEMTDADLAKHFVNYAKEFDHAEVKFLSENLEERVIKFAKENYSELEAVLTDGEFSASGQRERQNQIKRLSSAGAFIEKATQVFDQDKAKSLKYLDRAEEHIHVYIEEHGHLDDITGRAAKKIAEELTGLIEILRARINPESSDSKGD